MKGLSLSIEFYHAKFKKQSSHLLGVFFVFLFLFGLVWGFFVLFLLLLLFLVYSFKVCLPEINNLS